MLCTIIFCRIGMTRNGHYHLVYRINRLPTIHHVKDNCSEVVVGIRKLLSSQSHCSSSYKCSYGSIPTTKTIVTIQTIETIVGRGFIATHHMLCTIINCGIGMSRNGHYYLCYRINRLPTICHVKDNRSEVFVGICKLLCSQSHCSSSYKSSFGSIRATKTIVIIQTIETIVDRDFITTHYMLCTIINGCTGMTGNSHYHLCYRINRLPSVGHIKENGGKVFVGVGKLICRQTHVSSTYKCSFGSISTTKTIVTIQTIKTIVDRSIITSHHMLCTIINCRIGMTGNSHHHFCYRSNGLPTVSYVKDNCSKVLVCIRKLPSS